MKNLTLKLLLISLMVFPAMMTFSQGLHDLPDQKVCYLENYKPVPLNLNGIKSFFSEDFSSGTFPPAGWSIIGDGQDNWLESATNNAGGVAPEAMFSWSPQFVGNSKLVTDPIATSGYSAILLDFKHYVNDFAGTGYTLKVETTSDGTTWNEVWSVDPIGAIGPETLTLLIDNADVGSDNFQLAFTFDGDSYQINYWYIDDVILSEAPMYDAGVVSMDMPTLSTTGLSIDPGAEVINLGSETITFDVIFEIIDGSAVYSETVTVTDLAPFGTETVTFPSWTAIEGSYVTEVTAILAGDENPANDILSSTLEVVSGLVLKKPLYEEFTSSTCVPCVGANEIILEVLSANPDEYTLIKYQMDWPGSGDPYYTEEGGVRKDYYGVSWVPDLYINSDQFDPYDLTQEVFDTYASALTGLEISINEAAIDEDHIISISADLTPVANYSAGLTAHIVVIEKLTVGNIGSNGETEWHNVMMKMLPDASGTTLDALTIGQPVTLTESFDMDQTFMETPNDLAVVVFVQDDSDKSIIQSEVIDVDGTFAAYNVTYSVEDTDGDPVEGAEIQMEGNGIKTTDENGQAVYDGVFPGTYTYDVEAAGFFPGSGSVDVIDQDVFETVVLETPQFYWFEMFDTEIPADWTTHVSGWDALYWYGGKVIFFRQSGTNNPIMLITPLIDISPAEMLNFDMGEANGTAPAVFGTVTDPSDPSTFTALQTYYPGADWQTYEFDLSTINGGDSDVYLAWQLNTSDFSFFSFDNVIITEGGANPELCVPEYTTGCTLGDGFTDFALEEISNMGSGCADLNGTGWSQYLNLGPATLEQGGIHTLTVSSGYTGNFASIWIDFNDDYVLTEDEKVLDNYWIELANQLYTVDLEIPADAALGAHIMRARTNFANFCDDPCLEYAYGEAEDYMVNVVDGGPPPVTDCEDFDALIVGGYVAGQLGGLWTTWSGAPGTAEDALVSDAYSVSPSNSMLIEGGTDGLQLFNAATLESGKYYYSHNIYIPDGTTGYWNLQKDIVPAVEWGFQIMYDDDGMYYVDAGAAAAVVAPFSYDTWYFNEFIVDLDNDWAEFYIDGVLIIEYQWTLGTFGNPGLLTLGGANYFANPGAGGAPAGAHFDDVCFEDISPSPCEDFDALTVGGLVAEQLGGYWTTWSGTSADDATVTDAQSNSPSNSFIVDAGTIDLVLQFGDNPISSGQKLYSHYMYVPTGYSGYFNVQSEPTPGVAWVIELFFNDDGTGEFLVQGASTLFDYNMDTWFMVEVNFDLESGLGEVKFDGTQMLLFNNTLTIGGIDYYGWDVGGAPGAYYDDVCVASGWIIEPPVLPPPTNLEAEGIDTDIVLMWDAPGGDLVELVQHDGNFENAYYQAYDNGYGVVYDISAYPGATLELLDFRHSSWGIFGTWDYKLHIVDWDTYTSVTVIDGLQTTGDDQWEEGISLGSVAGQSGLVGIFLEPLSNDPADAYPCLDSDNVGPDGMSYNGVLGDFSAFTLSTIGDFLMDLWIMTAGDQILVKPPKYQATGLSTGAPRLSGTTLPAGEYTLKQSANETKDLLGYNVYYSLDPAPYSLLDFTTQTTYTHVDPGWIGYHCYYVTAVYDEGESEPSNIACVLGDNINEQRVDLISVYPNPATDLINIKSSSLIGSIIIYNQTGQIVATEKANDKHSQLNLSQYNPGIYLLRIETEKGVVSKRIIVE